jgi:hypothetical protein
MWHELICAAKGVEALLLVGSDHFAKNRLQYDTGHTVAMEHALVEDPVLLWVDPSGSRPIFAWGHCPRTQMSMNLRFRWKLPLGAAEVEEQASSSLKRRRKMLRHQKGK